MFKFRNNVSEQSGFTLVEMIVAIFAFSIILTIIGSVFVHALSSQRRALSAQRVEENLSSVMELMTRELRVAQPNSVGYFNTLVPVNNSCFSATSTTPLHFTSSTGHDILYYLSGSKLIRKVDGSAEVDSAISSVNVYFTQLRFCVRGVTDPNNIAATYGKQPRVTIMASVQDSQTNPQIRDDYETTVSIRFLSL